MIRRSDIIRLRDGALIIGDGCMVEACDRALLDGPDSSAWAEVATVIDDANGFDEFTAVRNRESCT